MLNNKKKLLKANKVYKRNKIIITHHFPLAVKNKKKRKEREKSVMKNCCAQRGCMFDKCKKGMKEKLK